MTRTDPLNTTWVPLNRIFIHFNSPLSSGSEINLRPLKSTGNLPYLEEDL